jgi:hypothetical protein
MATGMVTTLTTLQWTQMQQQFQIYQIASIMLFFTILGIVILFKDAFPFVWARFVTHDVVVGILNKTTGKIQANKDFKKYNNVYYYKGEPQPFIKAYPGNFRFAGWPFDIIDVDLIVINDPRYKKACAQLKQKGYPNIDALEKAIVFSQMNADDIRMIELIDREGYENYEAARAKINPANLTIEDAIVKQFFTTMPLSELIGYGTQVPADCILNEVDDVYEARKPSMIVKREIMKMLPVCAGIFCLAVAVVVIYWFFFKAH